MKRQKDNDKIIIVKLEKRIEKLEENKDKDKLTHRIEKIERRIRIRTVADQAAQNNDDNHDTRDVSATQNPNTLFNHRHTQTRSHQEAAASTSATTPRASFGE